MSARVHEAGCFVIAWSQTSVDGLGGAPVDALRRRAHWRWHGEAVRLDAVTGLDDPANSQVARVFQRHAEHRIQTLVAEALAAEGYADAKRSTAPPSSRSFVLTDGPRRWSASLIDVPELERPLILFVGEMPPPDISLRIATSVNRPTQFRTAQTGGEGVVCFLEGTRLETPGGPVAIEEIAAGDRVITKDGGAREVLWVGMRHISRARLMVSPDLRPVRVAAGAFGTSDACQDLLVSPDHRILTSDKADGIGEVLVAARDLVGRPGVARAPVTGALTYYHIMLAEHAILVANGVEAESFYPGATRLSAIAEEQRVRLFDIMPDLQHSAANYGPPARRVVYAKVRVSNGRVA